MSDLSAPTSAEENPRQQRLVLLLAVAAAGIVAALVGYFVVLPMFGPGGTTTAAAPQSGVTPSASASASPSPAATKLQSYGGAIGRDPFAPLLTGTTSSGGASTTGTGATGTGGTGTGATATAATPPSTFQVVEVDNSGSTPAVMARVGTAIHIATRGETIASVVKVVSLKGQCGVFLYGDESFRLCAGDPAKKLG
jgi:hypothetical protein